MKLIEADLARYGATVAEVEGKRIITAPSGRQLLIENPRDPLAFAAARAEDTPVPGKAAQFGVRTFVEFDHAILEIGRDKRLSDFGRAERLAPLRERTVKTLGELYVQLAENESGLAQQEAQRYQVGAPPDTDRGESREREIREWIRSRSSDERSALYDELGAGEDSALVRAVLHSPVSMGNLEKVALEGWRTRIDRDDPDGRAHLDLAHASLDWSRRALAAVQGTVLPMTRYGRQELLEKIGKVAAPHFGFTRSEIEVAERLALARRSAA